jgi:hypothetical protein
MKRELGYGNFRWILSLKTMGLFLTLAIMLGLAKPVVAAEPPDNVFELPAGVACDFDLRIEVWGSNQVYKEFTDKNGNIVRTLSAGSGSDLLFTNLSSGATFSLKADGSVVNAAINPDGSGAITILGKNIVINFPTDFPPGPSTTLYVGRVIFTVDTNGVWTLQQVSGQTTDICAALS